MIKEIPIRQAQGKRINILSLWIRQLVEIGSNMLDSITPCGRSRMTNVRHLARDAGSRIVLGS